MRTNSPPWPGLLRSALIQSARNYQRLAGDVGRARGEEEHRLGDIGGCRHPAEQSLIDDRLFALGGPFLRPGRIDETRRDRVDPNLGRERAGEVLRQVDQPGLARPIGDARAAHAPATEAVLTIAPRLALSAPAAARAQRNGPT